MDILLIEDDLDDQEFFIDAVNEISGAFVVQVCCNGKDALAYLSRSEAIPDIIFSDIRMPVMDGIRFLSEITNVERLRNIPVVMLSSSTEEAGLVGILGAKGFIEKTIDQHALLESIGQIVKRDFNTQRLVAY